MKNIIKKSIPVLLLFAVLCMTGALTACGSGDNMYKRHKSNKSRKVNTNIKVKGTNRANSHTTRSY